LATSRKEHSGPTTIKEVVCRLKESPRAWRCGGAAEAKAFQRFRTHCFARYGKLNLEVLNRLRGELALARGVQIDDLDAIPVIEFIEATLLAQDKEATPTEDQMIPKKRIPMGKRTRPMSLGEAAKLMGYRGTSKTAGKKLKAAMDVGSVPFEKKTRQQFIFSRDDFPSENQNRIKPKAR
jgi:hypothetical protein